MKEIKHHFHFIKSALRVRTHHFDSNCDIVKYDSRQNSVFEIQKTEHSIKEAEMIESKGANKNLDAKIKQFIELK